MIRYQQNVLLTDAEMVPSLLAHLNITHVSLASHSGGDIYLLNTMLTYPCLLHPETPYVCFFAPWVVRTLQSREPEDVHAWALDS
jgi:hypothetical protein